jgi:hypothetical protein
MIVRSDDGGSLFRAGLRVTPRRAQGGPGRRWRGPGLVRRFGPHVERLLTSRRPSGPSGRSSPPGGRTAHFRFDRCTLARASPGGAFAHPSTPGRRACRTAFAHARRSGPSTAEVKAGRRWWRHPGTSSVRTRRPGDRISAWTRGELEALPHREMSRRMNGWSSPSGRGPRVPGPGQPVEGRAGTAGSACAFFPEAR